ncbi:hypothetical protein AAHE18_18G061600 [Arachis hypogaea]
MNHNNLCFNICNMLAKLLLCMCNNQPCIVWITEDLPNEVSIKPNTKIGQNKNSLSTSWNSILKCFTVHKQHKNHKTNNVMENFLFR